jgi:lincosamide nucleotidyltransferase A/C/D/E
MKTANEMMAADVVALCRKLDRLAIPVWIDGGWCVDALLGRQTRPHSDLDVAIERPLAKAFNMLLSECGYRRSEEPRSTAWNYPMALEDRVVDVHVFEFDGSGKHIYGVQYPYGALNGEGAILDHKVRCVGPEWMFKFKLAYAPRDRDIRDIEALAAKYGFEIPGTHRRSQSR